MRKIHLLTLAALMLIAPLILIGGCKSNMWTYRDVILYSTEPEMQFLVNSDGNKIGTVTVDDQIVDVELTWGPSTFNIRNLNTVQDPYNRITYLSGGATFHKNHVDLKIRTDNIFDGKYKTIRIYRRAIEDGGK